MRLLLFLFLFAQTVLGYAADGKLYSDNQWHAIIVISDNPEINEWSAARSLSDWAEVVTGKKIGLVSESENPPEHLWKIYIGKTQISLKNGVSAPARRGDVAIRQIKDKGVFLIGNTPAATRIAVGRFCEQVLGITFCQPGTKGADYSILKTISIPPADLFQPTFYWRAVGGITNETSKDWAYSVGYGNCPAFSHNLYKIFTENEWKIDPSFFAEGQRGYIKPTGSGNDANPNLNHPQAATVARRYAEDWFKNNPESVSVAMGLNDTLVFDKKVVSEGWFRDRPVRTNYLIGFLNKVADGNWLNQNNPDETKRTIGTLAYLDTLKAPTVKVHPDIFPWVCVDRMSYANEEFAQQDVDNCFAWVKSGADYVGAYDYWYGNNFCIPRINFLAQSKSIKSVSQTGVTGWYAELYPIWAFDAPKAWIGAKLLENPAADTEVLLNQWFNAAYGPANGAMHNIFKVIEGEWNNFSQAQGKNQWIYGAFEESSGEILSDKSIDKINQYLATAERELTKIKNPNLRQRNYLWRLNQFKEAWNLVIDFREIVRLRKVQATTPEEAMSALEKLVAAEQLLDETQTRFNFKWGTINQKINWSRFTNTNPRDKWIKLVRIEPALNDRLMKCIQDDKTGLSILNWVWETKKSQVNVLNFTDSPELLQKNWLLEISLRKNSVKLNQLSLLAVNNQSGFLRRSEKIEPEKIVRFSVKHNPVGGKITLTTTFIGQDQSLVRSQQVNDAEESLTVLSPKWTEQVEFSIHFENAINLKTIEISKLDP